MGLVKKQIEGTATLFSSNLSEVEQKAFVTLFDGPLGQNSTKNLSDRLQELSLPMVGDLSSLSNEIVKDNEELVVRAVCKAKENQTLARSLPVVLVNVLPKINPRRLNYWAKRNNVKRELGFFVALTAYLSKKLALKSLSKLFYNKR